MAGGKSSSSSNSTSTTNTSSATSTGVVGNVLQGQDITVNQELPDQAVEVFKQLVDLNAKTLDIAAAAGNKAIDKVTDTAQQAAQPDVELIQGYQKQVIYAIIGAVATVVISKVF